MLDKLKITMLVGFALGLLRVFLPDLPVPDDFEEVVAALINGVFVVLAVVAGFFKMESAKKIAALQKAP